MSKAKAEDQGAVVFVLDLVKAFERVSFPVFWAWATHFSFPRKNIAGIVRLPLSTRGACNSNDVQQEPLTTITAILPGSKWSCLLLRIMLQDALSEVTEIYPSLKLRVFVDDITALVQRKKKEVAEMVKKVLKELKEEVKPQVVSH